MADAGESDLSAHPLAPRLAAVVKDIISGLPDEPLEGAAVRGDAETKAGDRGGATSIRATVATRLYQAFDSPKTGVINRAFSKAFTDDQIRELIFFPSPDNMSWYVRILGEDLPALSSSDRLTVMLPFLSMLYLHHLRDWKLTQQFILDGGLAALSSLLVHGNPHVRNQAIDCFLQITSHKDMDWFAPPAGDTKMALHAQMLSLVMPDDFAGSFTGLYTRTPFIAALLENQDSPTPGASFFCLQILAFWLSWARLRHTDELPLCLSAELKQRLQNWSKRADAGQEEVKLAEQVAEDFSRFPSAEEYLAQFSSTGASTPVSQVASVRGSSGQYISLLSLGLNAGGSRTQVSAAVPPVPSAAVTAAPMPSQSPSNVPAGSKAGPGLTKKLTNTEKVAAFRAAGNEHFSHGRFAEAIGAYSDAIKIASDLPKTDAAAWKSRMAPLYANRAMVYLKRARTASSRAQDLKDCLRDCDCALDMQPVYPKAMFRRAQANLELGRLHEARADANEALRMADCAEAETETTALLAVIDDEMAQAAKRHTAADADEEAVLAAILRRFDMTDVALPTAAPVGVDLSAAPKPSRAAGSMGGTGDLTATRSLEELADQMARDHVLPQRTPSATADSERKAASTAAAAQTGRPPSSGPVVKVPSGAKATAAAAGAAAPVAAKKVAAKPPGGLSVAQLTKQLQQGKQSNDMSAFFSSVRGLEPSTYSAVFQQSLTDELLAGWIDALHEWAVESPADALAAADALTRVARFSVQLRFLSKAQLAARDKLVVELSRAEAAGADASLIESVTNALVSGKRE